MLCSLDFRCSLLGADYFLNSACVDTKLSKVYQFLYELSDPEVSKSNDDESEQDDKLISSHM